MLQQDGTDIFMKFVNTAVVKTAPHIPTYMAFISTFDGLPQTQRQILADGSRGTVSCA